MPSSQLTVQWLNPSRPMPIHTLSVPKISHYKPQVTLCNLLPRPFGAFAMPLAIAHTLYIPDQSLEAPKYPLMSQDYHPKDYLHPLRTPTNRPQTLTYPV